MVSWETQFIIDASVDDASLDILVHVVHDTLKFNLSAVMINPKDPTVGGSSTPPTTKLSMQEISVIAGVAGMVVILVGIGIFVVFTRKPTSHDFSVYPSG